MPDTPQDSPPASTEGVEPVDINKILLWWQGQYTPAEHHQRFTDAKAAIERLIAEARKEGKLEAARYFKNYMVSNSPFIDQILDPYIDKLGGAK